MDFMSSKIKTIRVWIEDVLEVRLKPPYNLKLEDLFFVTYAHAGEEGDTYLETKFGRLKAFFSNSCPEGKTYVLDRRKYPYPKKGVPMTSSGDLPVTPLNDPKQERIN